MVYHAAAWYLLSRTVRKVYLPQSEVQKPSAFTGRGKRGSGCGSCTVWLEIFTAGVGAVLDTVI